MTGVGFDPVQGLDDSGHKASLGYFEGTNGGWEFGT
jgi:hypothetical protein